MTSGKRSLIALGLAALLGAAYWGWTVKLKPARDKEAADAKKPFAGLEVDQTQEVLLRKGKDEVLLRKIDGAWRLIKPVEAPADTAVVSALVKALGSLSREEVIAEKDADLRQYGLDQPSGAVTFTPATPGAKAKALFFGRDNPTGSSAYAMVDGEAQVFLTSLGAKNAVLKDAGELRDKTVWALNSSEVQELSSSQGGGFSLKRGEKAGWTVRTAAGEEPGRGAAIEQWLGELTLLKASKVPSENGKGGSFGLGKGPHLRLKLSNGRSLELHAGASPKEGGVYVQGAPGSPVFLLPASATLTLTKAGKDLADRQAFAFDSSLVERFEVKRPAGDLSALKNKGAWAWVGIPAQGKEFDFEGFLSRFSGAELLKRLPASAKPAKVETGVYFYNAAGTLLESAEFGADQGGGIVAVSGTKKLTSLVARNLLDGLPPAPGKAAP
jgi:hypothetical protein